MQTSYAVLCQPHHTDRFSTFIYALIWMKTAYLCGAAKQRTRFASSGYYPKWRYAGGDDLLNKVVIFVFFAYKKYSRSFTMLRLNHWWQMDYFGDVFHTFLGLDSVNYLAVNGTVTCLRIHPKYLKLCSEDEWSFYGFGTTWGKWLMT